MNLKGLTVNFLGDSITEGCGTTAPEKTFHYLIQQKYGLKIARNYGIGGTRIARQLTPSENTKFDLTFELRSDIMDKNAELIVVFGGTNDYGHGDAPFGELDSKDRYTFCGALNCLVGTLKAHFPKSKLVFMTPLHRENENQPCAEGKKTLPEYVAAMREIFKKHNVSVIDLFDINPIDVNDKELLPDGLHPSDKGHEIMADIIAKELMNI